MQWLPTDGAIGVERITFGAHQLASSARRTQRPGRISEDAPVDETDAQGMKTARAINVVVKNFYGDNAAVLAEWETARPG